MANKILAPTTIQTKVEGTNNKEINIRLPDSKFRGGRRGGWTVDDAGKRRRLLAELLFFISLLLKCFYFGFVVIDHNVLIGHDPFIFIIK